MNYWILTDSHFNHDKMVYKFKTRDKGFEEKIVRGFKVIKEDDIFIHLGDVSFGRDQYWNSIIGQLPCKKWLLIGNHDKHSISWYIRCGWDFIGHTMSQKIMGHNILFSHIPQPFYGDNYTINIHGHFHNNDRRYHEPYLVKIKNDRQYLLAIENNNYQLFNLRSVIEDFQKRNQK